MNVERLISDLARDIATAEPSPGFSTRVLDRIDVAHRRSRKLRATGATAGLLAAAALAVFVVRSPSQRPATPEVPVPAGARVEAASPVVDRPAVTRATAETAVPKRRSTPQPAAVPTAEEEWLARAVPALEASKPITIEKPHAAESIQPPSLQIPLMGMDVIGSDPLTIAPLGGIKH